jgi:hypothetical protein
MRAQAWSPIVPATRSDRGLIEGIDGGLAFRPEGDVQSPD